MVLVLLQLWDPRVGDPVVSLEPAAAAPAAGSGSAAAGGPLGGTTTRDCWTVAFGNSYNDAERVIVAGYDNGGACAAAAAARCCAPHRCLLP